jgi:hypothetical protein
MEWIQPIIAEIPKSYHTDGSGMSKRNSAELHMAMIMLAHCSLTGKNIPL